MSLAAAVVDEVRLRMRRHRLSQNALAKAAGMPPSLLHRAMNGERALSIDELAAVAVVLGVLPESIVRAARERMTGVTPSGERSESNSAPRQE